MTIEEAIKYLSGLPPYCEDCEFNLNECDGLGSDCKIAEANRIAIEAIEKQIPKEHHHSAIKEVDGKGVYFRFSLCPSCLKEIISYKNDEKPKYCTHCGQAIEWGEEE